MTEKTIKIKELISGQVDMGTYGLVELELLDLEKEINIHKNKIEILRKIISDKGIKSSSVCLDYKSTIL